MTEVRRFDPSSTSSFVAGASSPTATVDDTADVVESTMLTRARGAEAGGGEPVRLRVWEWEEREATRKSTDFLSSWLSLMSR